MASSGSISGLAISPDSTAPHKESLKWLVMMYLWASQSFELYFRSVAFIRDAELPFLLFLVVDARWARSSWWPPLAALLRRLRFLAILTVKPAYESVYTQDSGV